MSRRLKATLDALQKARAEHDSVLVAYSGGKDSLAVAELCVNTFPRVELFYMYLIKGLECIETQLDFARRRWGVPIRQYPHWVLTKCLRNWIYCDPQQVRKRWSRGVPDNDTSRAMIRARKACEEAGIAPPAEVTEYFAKFSEDREMEVEIPEWQLKDVWALARADTGINLIATGQKAADNMARRRTLTNTKDPYLLHPLKSWNKFDVLAYLKAQGIPLPENSAKQTNGIDLATPSLLFLHDRHPRDFRKLCEVFPFAEAVVWRREFFGIGEHFGGPDVTTEKAPG